MNRIANLGKCEKCGADMDLYPDWMPDENRDNNNQYQICEQCGLKLPDPAIDAWNKILNN